MALQGLSHHRGSLVVQLRPAPLQVGCVLRGENRGDVAAEKSDGTEVGVVPGDVELGEALVGQRAALAYCLDENPVLKQVRL